MNIIGKKIKLRAISLKDMEFLCDMLNDPDLESKVVGWSFPQSIEKQNEWYATTLKSQNNQRFIIENEDSEPLGLITLTDIDWKNRTATHGIKLANDSMKRKGIGTDAVMALQRYAFDELGLHRLESQIFVENIASINLYKKCGWNNEGIRKSAVYKNGIWKDLLYVGILEKDYRLLINENNYWS